MSLSAEQLIMALPVMANALLFWVLAIAGIVGAVMVASTRPDALSLIHI